MMKPLPPDISVIVVQGNKASMHVKYCVNLMKEVFFMQIEIQSNDENPIKRMRSYLEMTQEQFSDAYGIPVRTLQQWEAGRRNPPDYVVNLLERAVKEDGKG